MQSVGPTVACQDPNYLGVGNNSLYLQKGNDRKRLFGNGRGGGEGCGRLHIRIRGKTR